MFWGEGRGEGFEVEEERRGGWHFAGMFKWYELRILN